jgi:phytoene dehydrogenase-like protein
VAERRVAVVGAGLAGLSCAARLAHAGYRVDLYEQRDQAGGKAGTVSLEGFRFDTGPSLATMPHVFAQLFEEVGERFEDSLRFIPLAPICRYFFPDGTRLAAYSDMEAFGRELPGGSDGVREHHLQGDARGCSSRRGELVRAGQRPCNAGQDWQSAAAATRRRVLRRLSGALGGDLESEIQVEWVMTPAEIERETGSSLGSLYGISSNTRLAAFLRHRNRSRRPRGLYLCGGSVHPGGGMPLAVLSGKIAADLIRRHDPVRRGGRS